MTQQELEELARQEFERQVEAQAAFWSFMLALTVVGTVLALALGAWFWSMLYA